MKTPKSGKPIKGSSLRRVDGRAGRNETTETRTRWVVEWQAPNANWREASWQWSDEETARKGLSTVLQGSRDKWRLVEVVVVERRRVVAEVPTGSSIVRISDDAT